MSIIATLLVCNITLVPIGMLLLHTAVSLNGEIEGIILLLWMELVMISLRYHAIPVSQTNIQDNMITAIVLDA